MAPTTTVPIVDGAGRTAPIVAPDAAIVSNGLIHVIGGVLLPFALEADCRSSRAGPPSGGPALDLSGAPP